MEQNVRYFPGDDSYSCSRPAGSDRSKSCLATPALAPCADPLAFRPSATADSSSCAPPTGTRHLPPARRGGRRTLPQGAQPRLAEPHRRGRRRRRLQRRRLPRTRRLVRAGGRRPGKHYPDARTSPGTAASATDRRFSNHSSTSLTRQPTHRGESCTRSGNSPRSSIR